MASNPLPLPIIPYGVITVEGREYLERFQLFTKNITINFPNEQHINERLTLPGIAPFLLKGLSRDMTKVGPPPTDESEIGNSVDELFLFRLSNSPGSTWFFTGGLGLIIDRVISDLCFGSGQFPYPLFPPVPVDATGSLIFDVIDLGLRSIDNYPYMIHIGFIGSYLIPWNSDQPAAGAVPMPQQPTPGGGA